MTDYQVTEKNLTILRDYIEVKEDFVPNMADYGGISKMKRGWLRLNEVNDCGTCCCALGVAPSVRGLEISNEDFGDCNDFGGTFHGRFLYQKYSTRLFPFFYSHKMGFEFLPNMSWQYIFNHKNPNDRRLLLKRMNYVLENNLKAPKGYKT